MSEMIERVARAITRTAEIEHDQGNEDSSCECWLRDPHAVARAVLAEIREPTASMLNAGEMAATAKLIVEDGSVVAYQHPRNLGHRFSAMIDEALK